MKLSAQSSNVINVLKCVLCIGVVCVHGQITPGSSQLLGGAEWGGGTNYQNFTFFQYVFANCFCNNVCVPIFFILSGFLFFLKVPELFNANWFLNKYKSRIKSLLVPYLMANAIFILAIVLFDIYQGNGRIDTLSLLRGFWAKTGRLPADPPLWFMRDLFIVVLFSPLLYVGIKKISFVLPLLLGGWFICAYPQIPIIGISSKAFFFFSVGGWCAIKSVDFIERLKTGWLTLLYWIVYVITLFFYIHFDQEWILRLSVLPACPALISTVALFTNNKKQCPHSFVVCTVFTYLYHYYVPQVVWRILVIPFGTSEVALLMCFCLSVIITVVGFYYTYLLASRLFPKITSIIVGGR